MYYVWLGAKPILNRFGKPAKFKYDLALHVKNQHKFAKMRSCSLKGKWADRIAVYQSKKERNSIVEKNSKEYAAGADAYVAGQTIDQNPWDASKAGVWRIAAEDWDKGWMNAQDWANGKTTSHSFLPSLPIDADDASHCIVGTSKIFGDGILSYCRRGDVNQLLRQVRSGDPDAVVRVEPHNHLLLGKALRSTDVEWIVNDKGELGVKIGEQFFFMYKGESFMYSDPDAQGTPGQYRFVRKREFGESGPITTDEEWREGADWKTLNHLNANNELAYFE